MGAATYRGLFRLAQRREVSTFAVVVLYRRDEGGGLPVFFDSMVRRWSFILEVKRYGSGSKKT